MQVEMKKPVIVHCDNVGDSFVSHITKQSLRTKHINVRYHFIREYIVNGMVEIVFVPSEENDSDIFANNMDKETYMKHANKFITKMQTN